MERIFSEYFPYVRHPAVLPDTVVDGVDRVRHPVVIVGGGPTGLALALGLARHGVRPVVLEADDTVCTGSRAGAFTRRTIEIFEQLGIAEDVMATGLGWSQGWTWWRDQEVLRLQMPHDEDQQYPPAVSHLQNWIEHLMVEACTARDAVDIRWQSSFDGIESTSDGAKVRVHSPAGDYTMQADHVVACDGGRSRVREAMGLALRGTRYAGRYVIIDVRMETADLPSGRRCWFDPASKPGGTLLMYKKPDGMVRFDYQLIDDEDESVEMEPDRVFARVDAHLAMLGIARPWQPVWMTLYRASAMTLDSYRHGRVLFAGDAAHLVPIFGVRGMNSSIDDAYNLAWKLAWVVRGLAGESLLDSYSDERVYAARENLRFAMKSAEFMAPPSPPFRLMRDAVLSLATKHPRLAQLANPRQHSAIPLVASPLNARAEGSEAFAAGPAPGEIVPECPLRFDGEQTWLTRLLGPHFTVLWFGDADRAPRIDTVLPFELRCLPRTGDSSDAFDMTSRLWRKFDADEGTLYLVRPDGHVLGRWRGVPAGLLSGEVHTALARVQAQTA